MNRAQYRACKPEKKEPETDKPEDQKPEEQENPKETDKPQETSDKTKDKEQKPKGCCKSLTREFGNAQIKAIEGEGNDRKFILSFSSEEPYDRGYFIEILDHAPGAIDLTRLNSIGVLLFNHDRDKVMGKINRAWIEDNRGYAEIEFDKDDKSEVIYQKVACGTLKGVSVGYRIESIEEVMPGKTSADGRFKGPCDIARRWQPFEISIVSVPADPTVGVGRDMKDTVKKHMPTIQERQMQINKNLLI